MKRCLDCVSSKDGECTNDIVRKQNNAKPDTKIIVCQYDLTHTTKCKYFKKKVTP